MIDFEQIENTIDYTFKNRYLLQQAFVRRSYSEENGGENNEVLEFIGDKALDLAVIRILVDFYGQITEDKEWEELRIYFPKKIKKFLGIHDEAELTDLKKKIVQKKTLARCIDNLGFHKQLIMGKGDIANNVQDSDSVKEDLFEAIIGAVTIDCDYDMDIITRIVDGLLDFDSILVGKFNDLDNYVGLLQEWSQECGYGLPNYTYKKDDHNNTYLCDVCIKGIGDRKLNYTNKGVGNSHAQARMESARHAYIDLFQKGIIQSEFEMAVGEPIRSESIRQVNELVQKKLINKPIYKFTESHNEDGDSTWTCTLSVPEINYHTKKSGNTKKEAQRESAYDFLCFLMGYLD